MKSQVTKRSECSEVVEQERSKGSLTPKVKGGAVKWVRGFLASMLLKPSTWRWLMVHIPEVWEKTEEGFKQVIAWFSDLS